MMDRHEAITSAYVIPGQTWPIELCWLYDSLRESRRHAEVGVWCGRSLWASCSGMTGATAYAVDMAAPACGAAVPNAAWANSVLSATINAIDPASAIIERMPIGSIQAARELLARGIELDSVFLDGSHHYADVLADVLEWLPLLRPGGLLCGHDYSTAFPGVMDAVNELLPGFVVVPDTRIWWATTPQADQPTGATSAHFA